MRNARTLRRIEDFAEVESGSTPPRDDATLFGGDVPWVTTGEVRGDEIFATNEHLTTDGQRAARCKLFPPNSIIVAMYGQGATRGRTGLLQVHATTNQACAVILPSAMHVPRFLWHFLRAKYQALRDLGRGGNQPNLNLGIIRDFRVPLPPLAEQRRIAAILDKADGIRRKRREVVKLADEFLKSAFLEMFGDPVGNPRGWQVVELEETFADSPQLGTLVPVDETGTVPVVRVGQLGQPAPAWSSCGLVNIDRKEFERYELKPNDFLMARAIGSLDHLGKASIVGVDDPPAVFDSHVMRLRFNQDLLASGYFHTLLLTPGGRTRFLAQAARTAVQFNISGGKIARMKIPLPPSELQARFIALRDRTLALASGLRDAEVTAGQLFDSLVERAFDGGL